MGWGQTKRHFKHQRHISIIKGHKSSYTFENQEPQMALSINDATVQDGLKNGLKDFVTLVLMP